jgi:hypothetical protein
VKNLGSISFLIQYIKSEMGGWGWGWGWGWGGGGRGGGRSSGYLTHPRPSQGLFIKSTYFKVSDGLIKSFVFEKYKLIFIVEWHHKSYFIQRMVVKICLGFYNVCFRVLLLKLAALVLLSISPKEEAKNMFSYFPAKKF